MSHPHYKFHKGQWFKFTSRAHCLVWMGQYGQFTFDHTRNPKPAPWQRRVIQEQVR